jgi:hypothetical protein
VGGISVIAASLPRMRNVFDSRSFPSGGLEVAGVEAIENLLGGGHLISSRSCLETPHRRRTPKRRSSSPNARRSSSAVITLLATRRARDLGRAGPVPVTPRATDRKPPRIELRAPPLGFPERRRCRVRATPHF